MLSMTEAKAIKAAGLDEEPLVVVRLTRSWWGDKSGFHEKTSLRFLKRKCRGFNWVKEEVSAIGDEEFVQGIQNLSQCNEGIYELRYFGLSYDYETDSYEADGYTLVPFTEEA